MDVLGLDPQARREKSTVDYEYSTVLYSMKDLSMSGPAEKRSDAHDSIHTCLH